MQGICRFFQKVYLGLAGVRNTLYDTGIFKTIRINVPVISVGNIAWGGTGKTEMVKTIVRRLEMEGRNVLIVARGYKCKGPFPREVVSHDWDCDEMAMLKKALPGARIFVGPRREEVIGFAMERYPDINVVVLDDGFQYRRLHRDLDIVLIREEQGFLREGMNSLKRAGIIVISKIRDESSARRLADRLQRYAPVVGSRYKVEVPDGVKEADLVCGVADPDSVIISLQGIGVRIKRTFIFPDHYRYTVRDINRLIKTSENRFVLCTQKDWVKLTRFRTELERGQKVLIPIKVEVEFLWGEDIFWEKIGEVVRWTRYGIT